MTKLAISFLKNLWSGKRGSNPRPSPWQGDALSTELFPRNSCDKKYITTNLILSQQLFLKFLIFLKIGGANQI